jgi:hypothetical protein
MPTWNATVNEKFNANYAGFIKGDDEAVSVVKKTFGKFLRVRPRL